MRKNSLYLVFLLVPFFVFSQSTKKVLLIGIDGCRSDAMLQAHTPNIDNLIANGIFSPDALNDDITISGPGWSAILCGVWSDKHLVTGNDFSGSNYTDYPPITQYINEHEADLHTVSICHWSPINNDIIQDDADFKLNVGTDLEVSQQGADYLTINDPDFMFVHFDDCDHAGHSLGFSPDIPGYIDAIETTDGYIGHLLQAIEQRPTYQDEDWLILVTSDHGGYGTSHGGQTFDEQNVMVIASSPSIATGLITKDSSLVNNQAFNCLGENIPELTFNSNDYVQIPAHSNLDFGDSQDFTIECRVRTPAAGDVAIVGNKDWDSGNNPGFVFSFKYPNGPEWKVNIGDGSNRVDINTGGTIADNEWHTLSVSFDRDGMMKMYQDGLLLDSANISSIGDITTNEGLFIGADILGSYQYSGAIAEVRVWDTVLDETAIDTWHCTSIPNTHPAFDHLIGYWKLDEGPNQDLLDYSSFSNHAINMNTAWNTQNSIFVYDYSQTPRLVDVPATALAHLCIPIEEAWNLDGESLIPVCMISDTDDILNEAAVISIFPNPATNSITVDLSQYGFVTDMHLSVFNTLGTNVFEKRISNNLIQLDVSTFKPGVYYLRVASSETKDTTAFIIH